MTMEPVVWRKVVRQRDSALMACTRKVKKRFSAACDILLGFVNPACQQHDAVQTEELLSFHIVSSDQAFIAETEQVCT